MKVSFESQSATQAFIFIFVTSYIVMAAMMRKGENGITYHHP
jgi:hypothetical protein